MKIGKLSSVEYIERGVAIKELGYYPEAQEYIRNIPSADVAPVVRCGECYYKTEDGKGAPYCLSLEMYLANELDFYCANGERKEGVDHEAD